MKTIASGTQTSLDLKALTYEPWELLWFGLVGDTETPVNILKKCLCNRNTEILVWPPQSFKEPKKGSEPNRPKRKK